MSETNMEYQVEEQVAKEEPKVVVPHRFLFDGTIEGNRACIFKEALDALYTVNEETGLVFTGRGMTVRQIDPSHVRMVDIEAKKKFFSRYKTHGVGNGMKITIPTTIVKSFLDAIKSQNGDAKGKKKQKKEISFHIETAIKTYIKDRDGKDIVQYEHTIAISTDTGQVRNIKTNLVDFEPLGKDGGSLSIPKLHPTSKLRVDTKFLEEQIKDVGSKFDFITLETARGKKPKFVLTSRGSKYDNSNAIRSNEILLSDPRMKGSRVSKSSKASFSTPFLLTQLTEMRTIAPTVDVNFGENAPLNLLFNTGDKAFKYSYWVAPRIVDE